MSLTSEQRRLVQDNLRGASSATFRFMRRLRRLRGLNDDLYQYACLGLVEAARRFDPTRGVRFMTYATPWINLWLYRGAGELVNPVTNKSGSTAMGWVERGEMPALTADPDDSHVLDARRIWDELVRRLVDAQDTGPKSTDRTRYATNRLRNVEVFLQDRCGDNRQLSERYGISRELVRRIRGRLTPAFEQFAAELRNEAA